MMKKIKKYLRSSFTPKQIVVYESGDVKNYNLGWFTQITLVILSVISVVCLSDAIASYFINTDIIAYKNKQIAELQNKQVYLTSNVKTRLQTLEALSKQAQDYVVKVSNTKIDDNNKEIYISYLNDVRKQERNLYTDVATIIDKSNAIKFSEVNSTIKFVGNNNSNVTEDTLRANNAVLRNTLDELEKESNKSFNANEKVLAHKISSEEKLAKFRSPIFLKMAKKIIANKLANTSIGGIDNTREPVKDIVNVVEKRVIDLKHKDLYYKVLKDINSHIPHIAPLDSSKYRISSKFGYRTDPFTGKQHFHGGIDLAAMIGTKIHAPLSGVVTLAGEFGGYGNLVELNHSQVYHISTRYGHLSKILVKRGQSVKKGQIIALVGSTGRSTGAHLHFEIRVKNKPIDPCESLSTSLGTKAKYCLPKK